MPLVKRLLLAVALGAGLLGSTSAPANACEFSQCAWGKVVCSAVRCPIFCYYVSAANKTICIAR